MCIYPRRRLLSELEEDASPLDPLPNSTSPLSPPIEDQSTSNHKTTAVPLTEPPPLKDTGFAYPLWGVQIMENRFGPEARQHMHIISGSRRSLVYCTPTNSRDANPPITDIEAISNLSPGPDPDSRWPEDSARRKAAWEEVTSASKNFADQRALDGSLIGLVAIGKYAWGEMENGVMCIAWEEWSGRMVIVPKHFGRYMQVYDFSRAPHEGACLSGYADDRADRVFCRFR